MQMRVLARVSLVNYDLYYQFWFMPLTFCTSNNFPEQENSEWRQSPCPAPPGMSLHTSGSWARDVHTGKANSTRRWFVPELSNSTFLAVETPELSKLLHLPAWFRRETR